MLKIEKQLKEIHLQYGSLYLKKHTGYGVDEKRLYLYYKPRGSTKQRYIGNTRQSSFSVLRDKVIELDRTFLRQSLDELSTSLSELLDRFCEHIDQLYESGTYRLKTRESYLLQVNRIRKMVSGSLEKGLKDIEGSGRKVESRFKDRFLDPILDYHLFGTDEQGRRIKKPQKKTTIQSTFSVLGIFVDWCYDRGYINTDPWKIFGRDWLKRRVKEELGQMTFQGTFSDREQIEKYESFKTLRQFYLDSVSVEGINPWTNLFFQGSPDRQPSPIGHLIVFIQLLTGCRIREIVNLFWWGMGDQVGEYETLNGRSLDDGTLRDTYSELSLDYSSMDIGGKTLRKRGSTRVVPIPDIVRPILQDRWDNRNPDSPFVFNTRRSGEKQITEECILNWFKRFQEGIIEDFFSVNDPKNTEEDFVKGFYWDRCKKYVWDLEKRGFTYPQRLTSHDIRSFFITDLLERGIPLEQVSRFVGHTNVNTTRRYYIVNPVLKHEPIKDMMKEITTGVG